MTEEEREDLFKNTAEKTAMPPVIIEKDFWVCYLLNYLFHSSPRRKNFAFKGGTSLSKAFGIIERFSEDIDLILDWRVLGLSTDEPWKERSITKQDIFNKEINHQTEIFLKDVFLPKIQSDLNKISKNIHCYIGAEKQTIKIFYPKIFDDLSILQEIRLEIGTLALRSPSKKILIKPYVAEQYPRLFTNPSTEVLTVLPERTFWEKVTILHREAFRSENSFFPSRYSRHYYDLYKMCGTTVKENAFKDINLLKQVVMFKERFYHCSWARYDLAKPGTIKLMPPSYNIETLRLDYEKMQNMIFGKKPSLSQILETINSLEKEINELSVYNSNF